MGWNVSNILVNEAIANKKSGGGGSTELSGLADTAIKTPSNGQVLSYDSTAEKWVNSDLPDLVIYSLEEREIGKWVDNKTLYQKTIPIEALPNNTTIQINHNIPNIDTIWVYDGFACDPTNDGFTNQLNLPNTALSGQWHTAVTKTFIQMWAGSDRRNYNKVYVTVRYTKTEPAPVQETKKKGGKK